ncbi:MAG: 3'-5' exonuclease [Vulcanimicrobiota bacterium]
MSTPDYSDKLLAFDLETTGLDAGKDRIIEFCFVSLTPDLQITGRYHSLVDPQIPIPPENSEIHGITDAEVAGLPAFSAHAQRIQSLLSQATLIAHNGAFDMAILNAELVRCELAGLTPSHPMIDTLLIERYVNSHKLEAAYRRYTGRTFEGAHRAEADTLATIEVLRGQKRQHPDFLPAETHRLVSDEIKKLAGHELKEYLDHDRRFYRDLEGVVRFNFGQHRGDPVQKRRGYLEWMERREFSADTKKVVKLLLKS